MRRDLPLIDTAGTVIGTIAKGWCMVISEGYALPFLRSDVPDYEALYKPMCSSTLITTFAWQISGYAYVPLV